MKKLVFTTIFVLIVGQLFSQHTFQNHGENVGINTLEPSEALEVAKGNVKITNGKLFIGSYFDTSDNSYFKLRINNGGQIIRGAIPSLKLKLNESGEWPRFANLGIAGGNGNFSIHAIKGDLVLRAGGNDENKMILTNAGGGDIVFSTNSWNDNKIRMSIKPNGNVGIGTRDPDEMLTVKGTIHTQEVKVDLNGACAPDYVFDDGYNLILIKELEEYIVKNKHLPEIPSAKKLEKDGINLKEMNLLLLKKIEELTLYIIQQDKKIKQLERKIK